MGRLLLEWDKSVRSNLLSHQVMSPAVQRRGSVLRAPAPEAAVKAAERRLGARLPTQYRTFLSLSNGADADSIGVAREGAQGTGFLAVEHVEWAVLREPLAVHLWTEEFDLDPPRPLPDPGTEPVEVENFEPLKCGLIISDPLDAFFDVLVPVTERHEWQVWTFYKEGATAHRSLVDLLRWEIRQRSRPGLPERPAPAEPAEPELSVIMGEIRRGDLEHVDTLVNHVDDPRVFDLAVEMLGGGEIIERTAMVYRQRGRAVVMAERDCKQAAVRILGRSGRAEALVPLRAALAGPSPWPWDARLTLLPAMIDCGSEDALRMLRDLAFDPDAGLRIGVVRLLATDAYLDVDALRSAADDENIAVRATAINGLIGRDPPGGAQMFRDAAERDSRYRRRWLAEAVRLEEPDQALELLRNASLDPDFETARWALNELLVRDPSGGLERVRRACEIEGDTPDMRSLRKWARMRVRQLIGGDTSS